MGRPPRQPGRSSNIKLHRIQSRQFVTRALRNETHALDTSSWHRRFLRRDNQSISHSLQAHGELLICIMSFWWSTRWVAVVGVVVVVGVVSLNCSMDSAWSKDRAFLTDENILQAPNLQGNETVPTEPPDWLSLPSSNAIFLHMGKAAGGTVEARWQSGWKIHVQKCHPGLCPKAWKNNNTGLVLTIRDPVDRFVSAFYWRTLVLCNPHGDTRTMASCPTVLSDLTRLCKQAPPMEAELLFGEYYSDANRAAEDLCSTDTIKVERLRKLIHNLNHVEHPIQEWLDFPWKRINLFTIVDKRVANIGVEAQADAAVHWIYNRTQFEGKEAFQHRARFALDHVKEESAVSMHTSKSIKKELSPKGVKCAAEFFRKEYDFLRDHGASLCQTNDCREGVHSILNRRSFLFSNTQT